MQNGVIGGNFDLTVSREVAMWKCEAAAVNLEPPARAPPQLKRLIVV